MSKALTEQKVLKNLGIKDFRHLKKDHIITMASMLDKMDPEVAKKAIEQFPEFARNTNEIFKEYKNLVEKELVSNDESIAAYYSACNQLITTAQSILEQPELSFEEKKDMLYLIKEITEQMYKKDSENKNFICLKSILGSFAFVATAAMLSTALGGNTKINFDNFKKLTS